ncbi:MAG: hypothetical protein AB4058_15575 [Microcystaceae cyanobacterium]
MKSYLLTALLGATTVLSLSFSVNAGDLETLTNQKAQGNPFNLEYQSICQTNPDLPGCS